MALCPLCGEEYTPGGPCPGCGTADPEPVLVLSVGSENELAAACTALETASVPYYTRDRETGNYMRMVAGRSLYGTDLYAARHDLRRARHALRFLMEDPIDDKELLDAYDEFMENHYEDVMTEEEEARKDGGSYKTFGWFFVAFGVFLLLAFLTLFLR